MSANGDLQILNESLSTQNQTPIKLRVSKFEDISKSDINAKYEKMIDQLSPAGYHSKYIQIFGGNDDEREPLTSKALANIKKYLQVNDRNEVAKQQIKKKPTNSYDQKNVRQLVQNAKRNKTEVKEINNSNKGKNHSGIIHDLLEKKIADRTSLIHSINKSLIRNSGQLNCKVDNFAINDMKNKALNVELLENDISIPNMSNKKLKIKNIEYKDCSFDLIEKVGRHSNKKYNNQIIRLGELTDEKFQFEGILFDKNGNIQYVGFFQNNLFQGKGELYNTNPISFSNSFDYKNFDELSDKWIKYVGDFENGERQGLGVLFLMNSERFFGEFHKDKILGKGCFYKLDGTCIKGCWVNNKLISAYHSDS